MPCTDIKPNRFLTVKALVVLLCSVTAAWAEDPPADSDTELLPEIEANTFSVTVQRRSRSNRIYLFEDVDREKPRVGKIVLLRDSGQNMMAFRILKTYYKDRAEFAGKKIRSYDQELGELESGSTFLGIEKIADIFGNQSISPEERARDDADLLELETQANALPKVVPYDPELDVGTSPPPGVDKKDDIDDLEKAEDLARKMMVDEVEPFDTDRHWLSAGMGYFLNNASAGGRTYFSGAGLKYGLTFGKMIFLDNNSQQDSFTIETGLSFYKNVNYSGGTTNDSYTVMPTQVIVRYNMLFGEGFTLFFYAGVLQNFVVAASQATNAGFSALQSTLPAGGAGMMFRVGPKWFVRVDLGYDAMGGSLMLRF